MKIYCCGCQTFVNAALVTGANVYPHRNDLARLPFWKCNACENFVGCHHKTKTPTRPLGSIPTPEIKKARRALHDLIDPLWRDEGMPRKAIYEHLGVKLGYEYHTAHINTIEEATKVKNLLLELTDEHFLLKGSHGN